MIFVPTDRPYEIISVAAPTGIAIWKIGLNPDVDGHLSIEKAALLSGHRGEVLLHPPIFDVCNSYIFILDLGNNNHISACNL